MGLSKFSLISTNFNSTCFFKWTLRQIRDPQGVGLWKGLGQGWVDFFFRWVSWKPSKHSSNFWDEVWRGDQSLHSAFPTVFGLTSLLRESVAKFKAGECCNVTFIQHAQDWNIEEFHEFFTTYQYRYEQGQLDNMLWRGTRHGQFTVKRAVATQNEGVNVSTNWENY